VFQEFAGPVMRPEQASDPFEHGFVARASAAQKFLTRLAGAKPERLFENGFFVVHPKK
jgi:hypothetical protein